MHIVIWRLRWCTRYHGVWPLKLHGHLWVLASELEVVALQVVLHYCVTLQIRAPTLCVPRMEELLRLFGRGVELAPLPSDLDAGVFQIGE